MNKKTILSVTMGVLLIMSIFFLPNQAYLAQEGQPALTSEKTQLTIEDIEDPELLAEVQKIISDGEKYAEVAKDDPNAHTVESVMTEEMYQSLLDSLPEGAILIDTFDQQW